MGWSRPTTVEKCTSEEFYWNGAIWLATKWVLHQPGFALQPILLRWGTSSTDGTKNDPVANMTTLFARGVLRRSSSLSNLKPSEKTWHLENSNLISFELFFLSLFWANFLHLVHHTNCCLKQPYLGLKFLTDWCTSSLYSKWDNQCTNHTVCHVTGR
jgi:hypothetical protein